MDASSYKDHITSRGFNYHYFFSAPKHNKPFVLLIHGFPSTSSDWHYQVAFLKEQGYGLIVPDMLGYGGTAKPTNTVDYKASLMVQDVIEILNTENVDDAIAIGHDWGSLLVSRLANLQPERFSAFAFLAVSYMPPADTFDMDAMLGFMTQTFGYPLFGYWKDFSTPGCDKLIEDHWDSFYSMIFPADPNLWIENMAPPGAFSAWLLEDKVSPIADFISAEHAPLAKETFLTGGLVGPLNWYKVLTQGISAADDKLIPKEAYQLKKPVFFAACSKDPIALPAMGKAGLVPSCEQPPTIKDYDAGHWVQLERPDELNQDLLSWIESVTGPRA